MSGVYSLQQLADYVGAELRGDPGRRIEGLSTLQEAGPDQIAFLANPAYQRYLAGARAGAVILSPADAETFMGSSLVIDNPYVAYARLSALFDKEPVAAAGVHAAAVVHPAASVAASAVVGAHAVIEQGAVIGESVVIGPGCYVGADTMIGDHSRLRANVSVYHGVSIGQRVQIHSGTVIGADGFGFANEGGRWLKIHQLGGVVIGDDVEIGACTTIDRGALGNTVIESNVIIDNLVQIAHNVRIGSGSALAGCVGIAGSTVVGKGCVLAGGVGLVGHIELCDGVTVTGRTMITKSITEPGVYSSGTPFTDSGSWKKNAVRFMQMDQLFRRVSALEKKNRERDNTEK